MSNLGELIVSVESGDSPSQALVDWASNQMASGADSQSLNELAWLISPAKEQALELFVAAANELGYPLPSNNEKLSILAIRLAEKMVGGEMGLNEGCSKLCAISRELDSPDHLSVFELLAHEQYDHENLGVTAENIRPEILREVHGLLEKHNK